MESTSGVKITPRTLGDENDIDTLCLQSIHELMKDGASRKKLSPRDIRALKRAKTIGSHNETEVFNLETETISTAIMSSLESSDSTCTRTQTNSMHVISAAIPPDPLDTWPESKTKMTSKIKSDYLLTRLRRDTLLR